MVLIALALILSSTVSANARRQSRFAKEYGNATTEAVLNSYRMKDSAHREIRSLEDNRVDATELALRDPSFEEFLSNNQSDIDYYKSSFDRSTKAMMSHSLPQRLAFPYFVAFIGLVIAGLRPRLREYN